MAICTIREEPWLKTSFINGLIAYSHTHTHSKMAIIIIVVALR